MGYDPDSDEDITIVNGSFTGQAPWNVDLRFEFVIDHIHYDSANADIGDVDQPGLIFLAGNTYEITFTITNSALPGFAEGFFVFLDSETDNILYNTDGQHVATITPITSGGSIRLVSSPVAGTYNCDIDNISIARIGEYIVETLGIEYPDPKFRGTFPGTITDRWDSLASVNGKTGCLIAYNE